MGSLTMIHVKNITDGVESRIIDIVTIELVLSIYLMSVIFLVTTSDPASNL